MDVDFEKVWSDCPAANQIEIGFKLAWLFTFSVFQCFSETIRPCLWSGIKLDGPSLNLKPEHMEVLNCGWQVQETDLLSGCFSFFTYCQAFELNRFLKLDFSVGLRIVFWLPNFPNFKMLIINRTNTFDNIQYYLEVKRRCFVALNLTVILDIHLMFGEACEMRADGLFEKIIKKSRCM